MEKIEVSTFKEKKLVHIGESSKIYELPNNRILKIINQELIEGFSSLGFSYETKILNTKAKKVKEIVINFMENAYKLNVPLEVDVEIGKNWYDAK